MCVYIYNINVRVYVHVYMYVYIYIYMYTYIHIFRLFIHMCVGFSSGLRCNGAVGNVFVLEV